jgi:putative ABC transport system substrate-binding protein
MGLNAATTRNNLDIPFVAPGDPVIDRRTFIGSVAGGILAASRTSIAQQTGKVYRIGYMSAPSRASVELVLQAFLRALRDLGWVEGQNLVIEYRWADGKIERLPDLAVELVRQKVELIVAPAGICGAGGKEGDEQHSHRHDVPGRSRRAGAR